mmetsp:Transcript_117582/g.332646  ORF Transcript_117582/g.332646 Transcript_117582/m.332646 type:complete len:327 (+) Transcript_117582:230-1210(+)
MEGFGGGGGNLNFGGNSPSGGSAPPQQMPPGQGPMNYGGIPPGADDEGPPPGPLVQCEDCGRSFAEAALERHQKICKKVFMQKRKKFDSAANRLGEFENANQLISNAKKIEKEVEKVKAAEEQPGGKNPPGPGGKATEGGAKAKQMPKWKIKSLEFRQAMLAQKAASGDEEATAALNALKEELAVVQAAAGPAPIDPDKVQCPHCGRTFNKESAERHINICVKMFGGKPGGGRLVRGGGRGCQTGNEGADAGGNPSARSASALRAGAAGAPPPGGGNPGNRRGGGLPRGNDDQAAHGQSKPPSAGAPPAARRSRSIGNGATAGQRR